MDIGGLSWQCAEQNDDKPMTPTFFLKMLFLMERS